MIPPELNIDVLTRISARLGPDDQGPPLAPQPAPHDDRAGPPEVAPEVFLLVQQGRKIQAIKRYRALNPGIGLSEAKDVIDALDR